ncbi:alkylated DNA repair protein alkB homolog 8 isoform X2 [Nematostella vectensis]|nr:alkylated DNA repair protein alkB homolog 8 isoform X2 [Nematostella vectensis]
MLQFTCPEDLEKRFVHETYEEIAPGFRNARYKAWPCVTQFIKAQPKGSVIADIGCGTGKYLSISTDAFITGSDCCPKFVEIARERQHEVSLCDNLSLPYRDDCLDAVISVGVIHHLASSKRRLQAICELARVLRPGGKMMLCVWAMEQKHRKFHGQDVLVPFRPHKNRMRRRHQVLRPTPKQQSPIQQSKLVHDQTRPRSRSCGALNVLGTSRDPDSTRGSNDDLSLTNSTSEFHALRELLLTLKNRKELLMSNINAQVVKLHSDKDAGRLNTLLSKLLKTLFDERETEKKIGSDPDKERGLPNIPNLLSAFVKKIFKEKDEKQLVNNDTAQEDVEISSLSTESRHPEATSRQRWLFDRVGSFDSDCSETDLEVSKQLLDIQDESSERSEANLLSEKTDGGSDPDKVATKIPMHFLARLMETLSSSSETESDGSISPDLFSSDSEIPRTIDPPKEENSPPIETSPASSIKCCPSDADSNRYKALQRFYHVFREGELTDLITRNISTAEVIQEFYHHGNWVIVVEKL